jgi:hypothetical protein
VIEALRRTILLPARLPEAYFSRHEAQVLAIREKTARLKALRLAKEAEAQNEEPPPKAKVRPLKNRGKK